MTIVVHEGVMLEEEAIGCRTTVGNYLAIIREIVYTNEFGQRSRNGGSGNGLGVNRVCGKPDGIMVSKMIDTTGYWR